MKKLSLIAALALSTALTACGGGGGGNGTSFTGPSTLSNGTINPQSGTTIQVVNNTQKRNQNYEEAVAAVGTSSLSTASVKTTSASTGSKIDTAYNNMNKILVDKNLSSANKEDILLSLALAGIDITDLKNKSESELRTEATKNEHTAKAEDIYARLGKERTLSLNDVVLKDMDFENRSKMNFILDSKGNLTGMKWTDEANAEDLTMNLVGKGTFKTKPYTNYGFYFFTPDGTGYHMADEFSSDTPIEKMDKEELRAAFIRTAKAEWEDSLDRQNLIAWLETADMSQFTTEEDCEDNQKSGFYTEKNEPTTIVLNGMGKDVGLKYSDFGTIEIPIDDEPFSFSGGYEELSAKATDLPQVNTEMNFEGKAVALLDSFDYTNDNDFYATYNGTSKLNFKDGKETLITDFTNDGWHKVTIETDATATSGYSFKFEGRPDDNRVAIVDSNNHWEQGAVDITYYGENPKNPDEVAGSAIFEHFSNQYDIEAEIAFGAIRKP